MKQLYFFLTSLILEIELVKNLLKNCKSNPRGFEERIKKQKIHSFAKKGVNFKVTNKNKIMEVKMERDLFWNILFVALQRKNWYGWKVEVPFDTTSFLFGSHWWSNAKKSQRSLLEEQKTRVISEAPSNIDNLVFDDTFFLERFR